MPGVKKPVYSWMYWKAWSKLPSSGRAVRIASSDRDDRGDAPDPHQLRLVGLRPRLGVEVQREDGRDRIDLGGERRHDRRDQRREHQAQHAAGQQRHHARIGLVGLLEAGRQHHRGDARQHHDHRHQQLEEGGEHHALLRFLQVLGRERALDDVLVEAPVADVHDPHAAEQHARGPAGPCRTGLSGRQDHLEVAGMRRVQRLEARDHAGAVADLVQRQPRDQQAAQHQQRDLHDVGERDRLEPAVQLVQQREHAEQRQRQALVHAGDAAPPRSSPATGSR